MNINKLINSPESSQAQLDVLEPRSPSSGSSSGSVSSEADSHSTDDASSKSSAKQPLNRAVKKFVCEEKNCGKSFATSGHLSRHMVVHSGLKPYQCTIPGCLSRFSRHDNMLQHCRTHARKLESLRQELSGCSIPPNPQIHPQYLVQYQPVTIQRPHIYNHPPPISFIPMERPQYYPTPPVYHQRPVPATTTFVGSPIVLQTPPTSPPVQSFPAYVSPLNVSERLPSVRAVDEYARFAGQGQDRY